MSGFHPLVQLAEVGLQSGEPLAIFDIGLFNNSELTVCFVKFVLNGKTKGISLSGQSLLSLIIDRTFFEPLPGE